MATSDNTISEQTSQFLTGSRILVMDDEPCLRDLITLILQRHGASVDTASNGASAIQLVKRRMGTSLSYRLAILDLTVPFGLGGVETRQQLYRLDPDLTSVLISGHHYHPAMVEYRRLGFAGVLYKPFECSELVRLVARLVGRDAPDDRS